MPTQPEAPTAKMRRQHRAKGHVNFRSWFRSCVQGRKKDLPHTGRADEQERQSRMPEIHLDYFFPRDSIGQEPVTGVVLKHSPTGRRRTT